MVKEEGSCLFLLLLSCNHRNTWNFVIEEELSRAGILPYQHDSIVSLLTTTRRSEVEQWRQRSQVSSEDQLSKLLMKLIVSFQGKEKESLSSSVRTEQHNTFPASFPSLVSLSQSVSLLVGSFFFFFQKKHNIELHLLVDPHCSHFKTHKTRWEIVVYNNIKLIPIYIGAIAIIHNIFTDMFQNITNQ